MIEKRTVLPDNFIEQRTAFATELTTAEGALDPETVKVALMSAAIDNLIFAKRLGELQAQVDRLESQLAALQRTQAGTQ